MRRPVAEVHAAVSRHEMWLNEKAEAEVRRSRMEIHQSLYAHEVRQHQLAQISRDVVAQGEAQFMENAESEMQQFGQYVVSHSMSEHREKLEESTHVVRRFFERQYEVHAHNLNEEYQKALQERSAHIRDECHSELLKAEAHVGAECRQATAALAVAESNTALAQRRTADIVLANEQQAKAAAAREISVREHQEALALQDKLHLRAEMTHQNSELAAVRSEANDARTRLAYVGASEAALAREVERLNLARNQTHVEAEAWTNDFRQEASHALMEAESSLQGEVMDAVLEVNSCRAELEAVSGALGSELEEARGELRQAEASAAMRHMPCPPPPQRPACPPPPQRPTVWPDATTPQSWNIRNLSLGGTNASAE